MYFKKLEMYGFKSFAEKTALNFEPGITAVVGPNGCGKSNVFDAIRWALGEQSSKELRGSSMSDVIFNGTDKKQSLGFAEVSLTFGNDGRGFPNEDKEVSITRRLYRSGESEYLINKKLARRKDIQEMLMGTGLGADAYCMIQQGKVDRVVNAKAEERREIFDEAAGITKYKAKKKEALSKLKDAENNLLRVTDITTEVKRQIASIERQANKARRYKEEYEKLKDLDFKYAKYELDNFASEKGKLVERVTELKDKHEQLNIEHDELSNRLTHEINYLDDIEQKAHELRAEVIKLDGQIEVNKRQIEFNNERIAGLKESSENMTAQKGQLTEQCKQQQEKIEAVKKEITDIEWQINSKGEKLTTKREELARLEGQLEKSKEAIRDNEEKILNYTSKQVNLRNELTDIMKEIQGALARKRRLDLENSKVINEKQDVDLKLQNIDYQISCLYGTLIDLENVRDNKNQYIKELISGLTKLGTELSELEHRRVCLESQKEFIERLQSQYQDIPDPIVEGRLLTETPPEDHHTGIIGKVKSVRELNNQPAGGFRSFLGNGQEKKLYEIICETKFIELDPQQVSLKIAEMVETIDKKTKEKQELQLRVDDERATLKYLQDEIQEKEKYSSILQAQRKDILSENEKICGELSLLEVELKEVTATLEDDKKREDQLNYDLDTVTKELGWCQNEIKEKQESIAQKIKDKEEINVSIAQLDAEWQSTKDKLNSVEANKRMFAETLDGWLDEMKKIDDQLVVNEDKAKGFVAEIEGWQEEVVTIESKSVELREDADDCEAQKDDLSQKINALRENIAGIEDEIDLNEKQAHELQMKEQKLDYDKKSIRDRIMQSYKIDLDTYSPELEKAKAEFEANTDPICVTEAGPVYPEMPADHVSPHLLHTHSADQEEVFNVDEALEEIQRLRKRCDSFGNVNLDAMDEYEELRDRFEFLTSQQSDLLEAKSQLMSTINKINRSTRQLFLDTFTRVGEEFRIYFRMLFGGGEAELILLDPENVLESGIDIVARPPGKKLQNIGLLSGGEKTLTAIALIFGVFKVNPSPFCVLDEIDAALDESNVGRFSYLLKDFAKISQFIVISHNKKTIESADVLYGVTMPETGVSRTVSVRMSESKELPEEIAAGV